MKDEIKFILNQRKRAKDEAAENERLQAALN